MRLIAAVAALAVVVSGCAATPAPQPPTASVVDEVARHALDDGHVVGLAVVVARGGTIVLERGYGRANLQTQEPMTRDAILDYFSIGKHTTAAILLRLAERRTLDLDAPARLYLPDADFEGHDVTTRQLLSHTSGLWEAEQDENDLPASYRDPPPDGAILAWANRGERLAAPGETWMLLRRGFPVCRRDRRAADGTNARAAD